MKEQFLSFRVFSLYFKLKNYWGLGQLIEKQHIDEKIKIQNKDKKFTNIFYKLILNLILQFL